MNTTSLHVFLIDMRSHWRVALARALCFLVLWIILMPSAKPSDLICGLIATLVATQMSLRLLPPSAGKLRVGALLIFVPHFLAQSLLAGIDVARRALNPRLRLNPGIVVYRVGFPPGMARNGFAIVTSLLPGSLPVDDTDDGLVYHCLDVSQPIGEQLADEERRLANAFISGERNG
ncbi:Na+/H+ antiporter subunit E [Paraburkholderia rhizosphaerae]|uniref:Multisubunit sodium/proton antiporter MrpE subunit n=1 Tax=Paraburkholderia rhizosphaerae TaxID=480658 RepID=A0A4V3HEA8_9BURK|nr:Na+/H+ antiporter subunit E [Paraburkholderia rhizosphaerae]TDY45395.1 multisubunit sodium/proton antiporter MrpE subunit [Paraburkholderia rhizosphaerae]